MLGETRQRRGILRYRRLDRRAVESPRPFGQPDALCASVSGIFLADHQSVALHSRQRIGQRRLYGPLNQVLLRKAHALPELEQGRERAGA